MCVCVWVCVWVRAYCGNEVSVSGQADATCVSVLAPHISYSVSRIRQAEHRASPVTCHSLSVTQSMATIIDTSGASGSRHLTGCRSGSARQALQGLLVLRCVTVYALPVRTTHFVRCYIFIIYLTFREVLNIYFILFTYTATSR